MKTGDPKVFRSGSEEDPTMYTGLGSEIVAMNFCHNWTPEVGEW